MYYELSEENFTSDIHTETTEDSKPIETPQVNVLNKSTQDEDNSPSLKHVTEFELTKENGEQKIGKENNLLSTNFQIEVENQKVEGLIMYSLDQQIFKFKVNSENNQELWGVHVDFKANQNKWTIDAILQHMGFYPPTENPCVLMRENRKTKSSEYCYVSR